MNQSQINNLVEKKHGPLNHQPDILASTSGSNHPCQRILGCPKRNQKRDWKQPLKLTSRSFGYQFEHGYAGSEPFNIQ
jgi:hypothetical protein